MVGAALSPLTVERSSVSHRVVFLVLSATLAGAFVVALLIHERFARHQPVAALHLPERVASAFRLDVEQTVGFSAFEETLLPLLELGRDGPEPRVKHLERKTTIELAVDAREVIFAEIGKDDWLLLVAGLFRRDEDVLSGIVELSLEEGVPAQRHGELVVWPAGPGLAVAKDGTLILASEARIAQTARETSGAGSFKTLLQKPAGLLSSVVYPPAAEGALGPNWQRFWSFLEAGQPHPAYWELVLTKEDGAPALESAARALFAVGRWEAFQEQDAPEGIVAGSTRLPRAEFEAAVARWAGKMSEHLSRSFASKH